MIEQARQTQEQYLSEYSAFTEAAIQQMEQEHANGPEAGSIICDKDEMFGDTVENHTSIINRFGERHLQKGKRLPTYEEVIAAGGTGKIYAELFGQSPDEWEATMEHIRSLHSICYGSRTYSPRLNEIMGEVVQMSTMLGYVTATPAGVVDRRGNIYRTQRFVERDLFQRLQLPRKPAILRPATIHSSKSGEWKTGILERIRSANPAKPVTLIDDSLSTAKVIAAANAQRAPGEVPLFQIVMSEGSLTRPKIESGAFTSVPELGIYIADWDHVPEVLNQIQTQWNPQK